MRKYRDIKETRTSESPRKVYRINEAAIDPEVSDEIFTGAIDTIADAFANFGVISKEFPTLRTTFMKAVDKFAAAVEKNVQGIDFRVHTVPSDIFLFDSTIEFVPVTGLEFKALDTMSEDEYNGMKTVVTNVVNAACEACSPEYYSEWDKAFEVSTENIEISFKPVVVDLQDRVGIRMEFPVEDMKVKFNDADIEVLKQFIEHRN